MSDKPAAVKNAIEILEASMSRAVRMVTKAQDELGRHRHSIFCYNSRWCRMAEDSAAIGRQWHDICFDGARRAERKDYGLAIDLLGKMLGQSDPAPFALEASPVIGLVSQDAARALAPVSPRALAEARSALIALRDRGITGGADLARSPRLATSESPG